MIDFGKTSPLPKGMSVSHSKSWQRGNHEDGYLTGLGNLLELLESILEDSLEPDTNSMANSQSDSPNTNYDSPSSSSSTDSPSKISHLPVTQSLAPATDSSLLESPAPVAPGLRDIPETESVGQAPVGNLQTPATKNQPTSIGSEISYG